MTNNRKNNVNNNKKYNNMSEQSDENKEQEEPIDSTKDTTEDKEDLLNKDSILHDNLSVDNNKIDSLITGETEKTLKSNYQISLINENLLRIVVLTDKSVEVDCMVKNKKDDDEDSKHTQTNKILVHPNDNNNQQEVEIIVSIDNVKSSNNEINLTETDYKKEISSSESTQFDKQPKKKLVIDPSVSDLVNESISDEGIKDIYKPKTREEYYEERLKPNKNRYILNRILIEKNLKAGIIFSVILTMFSMIVYSEMSSDNEISEEQKLQRMIVIQDIPEMQVDIPLEEKEDENQTEGEDKTIVTPKINIKRNRIRTPKVEITKKDSLPKDTTDIAKMNDGLDKDRKGDDTTKSGTSVSGTFMGDTTNANTVILPKTWEYGWTLIDSLEKGGIKFKFSSDTSQVMKDPGKTGDLAGFQMFIFQDLKGSQFYCGKNLRDFPVNNPEYKAVKCEPREESLSSLLEYMYRIENKNKTYAVTIKVEYKKDFRNEYFDKVDEAVKSIKLPEEVK